MDRRNMVFPRNQDLVSTELRFRRQSFSFDHPTLSGCHDLGMKLRSQGLGWNGLFLGNVGLIKPCKAIGLHNLQRQNYSSEADVKIRKSE